jgi:hypothetical protein
MQPDLPENPAFLREAIVYLSNPDLITGKPIKSPANPANPWFLYATPFISTMNCGRCGRQMFKPGEVICEFCKKTVTRDASKHAERMNRRKDQEEELFKTIAAPGAEEDTKDDMHFEHYVDHHDASAVWADGGKKGKHHKP